MPTASLRAADASDESVLSFLLELNQARATVRSELQVAKS